MATTTSDTVSISARDGAFDAYRVLPATTPAAAVILVAPIFGVTDSMKEIAQRFAARGFIALVPDPFWRVHPGPLTQADRPAAQERGKAVAQEDVMHDIERCVEALREMPENNGTVAIAGYCFGGKYAFLAAARGIVDAAAAFHGTRIGTVLEEAPALRVPLSLHFGEEDTIATMDEVRAVEAALAGKAKVDVVVYPGVGHGFTQSDQHAYDAGVTTASEARVFDVFAALD